MRKITLLLVSIFMVGGSFRVSLNISALKAEQLDEPPSVPTQCSRRAVCALYAVPGTTDSIAWYSSLADGVPSFLVS
jgi:hypothetical protein